MLIRQPDGSFKEVSRVVKIYKPHKDSEKDKLTNERQAVIKEFVEKLNDARLNTDFKPVTGRQIAVKLSHLNMFDLKYFLASCKDSKNFSSHFWYSLKVDDGRQQKKLL